MRFELKVVIGFLAALALIFVLGLYYYRNNIQQVEANRWVNHTTEVLYRSEQLLATLSTLEASKQGYVLSGKNSYFTNYQACLSAIPHRLSRLKAMTQDNKSQYFRLIKLQTLIKKKLNFCEEVIETYNRSPEESRQMISSLYGKKLMDSIRELFDELISKEKQLLKQRAEYTQHQREEFNTAFSVTFGITAILILSLFYIIYHNLKARLKAEDGLKQAAENIRDLYNNAPCGYHSLDAEGNFLDINQTMLNWLGYKREELIGIKKISDVISPESLSTFRSNFPVFKAQGFIHNLEFSFIRKNGSAFPGILSSSAIYDQNGNFIKSRSTTFDYTEQKKANDKILALNQELEAFTYTVSHDLRSPLRSITGYTKILQEDYRHQIDMEGQRVMDVVIKNTTRMGHLIDDLLNFSQIGRKELSNNSIDTDALVKLLVKEAYEQQGNRPMEIKVHPLHPCHGDYNMIRQVWENLINNAIKYSQKKTTVRIEIGSTGESNDVCYYIKDNGAGFEMQFVHKLFGVFQRLHRQNEFEGTGVGLAIVKRIINRHGGKVWAEGEPGIGATFHFCIPN